MNDQQKKIETLSKKIDALIHQQNRVTSEIKELKKEFDLLNHSKAHQKTDREQKTSNSPNPSRSVSSDQQKKKEKGKNLEKFIGGNLISKVGIIITILGVALGVRYSIEHELISPPLRITLGYLFGFGLLITGLKLKKSFLNYSAVLTSGAITMLYFISYFAYSLYNLFPQLAAFIIMVVFTLSSVVLALNYNKQIIAHLGLTGAYAVPFLLSDDSGNAITLFNYISIINIGILYVSFFKNWKPIIYSSFGLSWLIFLTWYSTNFQSSEHFGITFLFLILFYGTFYSIVLIYKLIHRTPLLRDDILLLLVNSFIFYGIGYHLFDQDEGSRIYLGLFSVGNAIVHSIAALITYRQKLPRLDLFYFLFGLAIVFISVSIPVQLDGNWVTLLWTSEATLLFTLARKRNLIAFEKLAYPLMFLAFLSLMEDWQSTYVKYKTLESTFVRVSILSSVTFFVSLLFLAAFGFMNYINQRIKLKLEKTPGWLQLINICIPAILILTSYFLFRLEIENYWHQKFIDSFKTKDYKFFSTIWVINYSLFFFSLLEWINHKKLKNRILVKIHLITSLIFIALFLLKGLYSLSELRVSYLDPENHLETSKYNLLVRYLSYLFLAVSLYSIQLQKFMLGEILRFKIYYELLISLCIIWVLSSELIGILHLYDFNKSYKLSLSILWGSSSLFLIVLGIIQQKKHLRIAAISFFAVTLLKLFLYDISHLDTLRKTIVFIALGILLLITSFLYNKFNKALFEENG